MIMDFENKTVHLTAIFQFKTQKAVKVKLDAQSKEHLWIPFSQVTGIFHEDGTETDIINLNPEDVYIFQITAWIACKMFDCEGYDELIDLELSFISEE